MMPTGTRAARVHVRSSLLVLAGLAAGTTILAAQAPRTLTLDEAVRLAEAARPAVIQARAQIRNAEAARLVAKGLWLPNLNASAQGNQLAAGGVGRVDPATGEVVPGGSTTRSVNFGLNSSVDLFDGFRRYNDRDVADAQLDAAGTGLTDARFQTRLQVTNQFYTLLAAQQLLSVREASVRRADEQLRQSVARLRAGSATRSDSLRSLVAFGTARGNTAIAQRDVIAAEASLGQLTGLEGRAGATDDSSYYKLITAIDTVSLVQEAAAKSPIVQNTAASATAAQAQLRSVKAAYWPTLTLSGSYTFNGSSIRNYDLTNQRQLNLGINWAIFNKFVRERNVALQVSNIEIADATAAEAVRQVRTTVISQLAGLDAAQTRITIAETSVVAASEDLRVQQERYRLGAATIVEVLTSQEALNQTEVDVVVARFDFLRARAQIEAVLGRTL